LAANMAADRFVPKQATWTASRHTPPGKD
jgi:hypothetical protein